MQMCPVSFRVGKTSVATLVLATGFFCGAPCMALQSNQLFSWQHVLSTNVNGLGVDGQGVDVAVVEACLSGTNDYRINTNALTSYPYLTNKVVHYHDDGSTNYGYSWHASQVAGKFVGTGDGGSDTARAHRGPAIGISTVHNYEANFFLNEHVLGGTTPDQKVFTCSFLTESNESLQVALDRLVDDHGKIFCVGVGNTTSPPPSGINNCYNVIAIGKTRDDIFNEWGRSQPGPGVSYRAVKPDIVAPGSFAVYTTPTQSFVGGSSFSTPFVAGAAALLVQVAGVSNWTHGADPRVVKALLLAGAWKSTNWNKGDWTHAGDDHAVPLDYRVGAGCLNVLKSYEIMTDGPQNPGGMTKLAGWTFSTITNSGSTNVFYLDVPYTNLTLAATLAWHRRVTGPLNQNTYLSDLNLHLWSVDNDTNLAGEVDWSSSTNSSVEHLWVVLGTNRGRYALAVTAPSIAGGSTESYALAWHVLTSAGDEDLDGLLDSWEVQYFGGITNAVPADDSDEDGMNNAHEYVAGTDPTDAGSLFRFTGGEPVPDEAAIILRWPSASNRTYAIQATTNLLGDFESLATNLAATPPENAYTDTVYSVREASFYRARVRK